MTDPAEPRATFARVEEIFHAARSRPKVDRVEFVTRQCGEDRALAEEVLALLATDESAEHFLDRPAEFVVRAGSSVPTVGDTLGRWTLITRIGVGGMGVVWLAQRTHDGFTQRAALKRMLAARPSPAAIARFERERALLARLEHEHIARLLDGGVDGEGLPWIAMELVEGTPLTEWCDTAALAPRRRIELFLDVCSAVSYAHRHLIVHRDLKPANVLVTADGAVKLLDFGIAKELDADGDPMQLGGTRTGQRPFTPAYASPEQIRADEVTTATDVWSLGVIAFELLTSSRPHRATSESAHDLERAICDEPPTRLADALFQVASTRAAEITARYSTGLRELARLLDNDLETILATALRKEPERRYASVDAFAADLRRWLDGMPIAARPDTFGYRASKFIARNRMACAAATAAAAFLIAGFATSMWLWRDATLEADRANEAESLARDRLTDVRALVRRMMLEVHDEIARLPGATAARDRIARTTEQYLDALARDALDPRRTGTDASLLVELADGYARVAEIQAGINIGSTGRHEEALETYDKLLAVVEELARLDERSAKPRWLRATTDKAGILLRMGRVEPSRELLATLPLESLDNVADVDMLTALARVHEQFAQSLHGAGQPRQALEHIDETIALWERIEALASDDTPTVPVDGPRPGSKSDARHSGRTMLTLRAGLLLDLGRFDEATEAASIAIDAASALARDRSDSAVFQLGRATALLRGAEIDRRMNKSAAALEKLEAADQVLAAAIERDANNVLLLQRRLGVLVTRGDALREGGRFAEAHTSLRLGLALADAVVAQSPTDHGARHNRAALRVRCAECAVAMGELDVALEDWRAARDECASLLDEHGQLASTRRLWVTASVGVGKTHLALGAWDEGLAHLRAAVGRSELHLRELPPAGWIHETVGESTYALAIALEQRSRSEDRPLRDRLSDLDEASEWFSRGREAAAACVDRLDRDALVAAYQADVDRCASARSELLSTP